MAKQVDLDKAYMECAFAMSKISYAQRKKVGAIIVNPEIGIIGEGVNGTLKKFDNCCEETNEAGVSVTKLEVTHAESNCILKIARSTNTSVGATMYCTLSPCFECAKLIIQAGIVRVVYYEQYPYMGHAGPIRPLGLELLQKANIVVEKLTI